MIKKIIKIIYMKHKNIHIDIKSKVSLNTAVKRGKYPTIIINSSLGEITYGQGCKFINCVCQGNIEIGRAEA